MPGGLVVLAARDGVGRVLLGDDALLGVVRVLVTLAVAQPRGAPVAGIAEVGGHRAALARPDVLPGRVDRFDHGVGLRCQGQVDGGAGAGGVGAGGGLTRAGGGRTTRPAGPAAPATPSADGSAIPTSSLACTMIRLAMNRGSSPASIILAR